MRDRKSKRRAEMANHEQRLMLARYESECVDFPPRMETPEEKKKRIKRLEQEKRHKDRYWIK